MTSWTRFDKPKKYSSSNVMLVANRVAHEAVLALPVLELDAAVALHVLIHDVGVRATTVVNGDDVLAADATATQERDGNRDQNQADHHDNRHLDQRETLALNQRILLLGISETFDLEISYPNLVGLSNISLNFFRVASSNGQAISPGFRASQFRAQISQGNSQYPLASSLPSPKVGTSMMLVEMLQTHLPQGRGRVGPFLFFFAICCLAFS